MLNKKTEESRLWNSVSRKSCRGVWKSFYFSDFF